MLYLSNLQSPSKMNIKSWVIISLLNKECPRKGFIIQLQFIRIPGRWYSRAIAQRTRSIKRH